MSRQRDGCCLRKERVTKCFERCSGDAPLVAEALAAIVYRERGPANCFFDILATCEPCSLCRCAATTGDRQ
jgi:hypothetical protein